MRKRPLLLAMCVFWLGIVLRSTGNVWMLIAFVLVCLYDVIPFWKIKRWRIGIGRGLVLLLIFLFGVLHTHRELGFRENYLSKLKDGDEITVWGEIYKEENLDESTGRIFLADCYVSINQNHIPCNNVMVYVSSADYGSGTILKIKGQFHNFKTASNEGNFDGRSFYQSQKIDFYVNATDLKEMGEEISFWERWILDLKNGVGRVYDTGLSEKWAGIMKGIVLGDKTELDETLKNLFTASGIVHILTVSGLHVSVLGQGLYKFLRNRRWSFLYSGIAAGILLLGYGYLTGNGVSTQRAIGMMMLYMVAQWIGRSNDMLNSMGGICFLLLWDNPFLTEYTGLWFSVMALIGVGWMGNYLSEGVKKGKSLWMSIGVTLATLPVVALCYYEVPIYSPILNCIVIPLLTPVFICGVLGGILGLFLPAIGKVILLPCGWILWLYEWLCEWMKTFPFSSVITGIPPTWLVIIYYIVLGIGILWIKRRNEQEERPKGFEIKKVLFAISCFLLLAVYEERRDLEITFLDVGQGDGIHIAIEDTHFFIDGGSADVTGLGKYRLLPYLKANGIPKIEYWFISHADTDHMSGLLEVIEAGYPIQNLVLSAEIPKDENYEKLISAAEENEIVVLHMRSGDVIRCGDGEFRCLYPGSEVKSDDRNELSLVMEFTWKDTKALFAGDISSEVEKELVKQGVVEDVWLFKATHHGSKYSNSAELLEVIRPEYAVISCSSTNRYGHPALETIGRILESGAEIFYTMDAGQITIQIDEKGETHIYEFRE